MCQLKEYNYPQANGYLQPNMKNFQLVDGDFDYVVYQRCFSGKLTKERYKTLHSLCRIYSRRPRYRCGHEWDCCGCLCGQNMSFTYKKNQVVISFSQSFNY